MKIIDVKAYAIREEIQPYMWRAGLPASGSFKETTVLRLVTDEGLEGVATFRRGAIAIDLIERRLKKMLLGQNPLLKEKLWRDLWELDRSEEFPIYMMGGVDVALWDLTAKAAGLPLYQLLGGFSEKVPAYASTVTYDSIDQYLSIADQILERGFKAIKLHAWGDAKKDAELAMALRKHVGDGIALMYDGSGGFDLQQSIWLGKQLEEAGFLWYEEPMREYNIHNYKRLCEELTIPVLSAETSDGCHYNAADFILFGAADMIRTSTHLKGGITGALRIAHLADACGMKAEIHSGGLPNLHLACAIPNNSYYEIIISGDPIASNFKMDREGYVAPPACSGTGEQFDWEVLERTAYLKI
jgi:L-alanine-DL-glutamate epimerase-like enolase superfamily enzyme